MSYDASGEDRAASAAAPVVFYTDAASSGATIAKGKQIDALSEGITLELPTRVLQAYPGFTSSMVLVGTIDGSTERILGDLKGTPDRLDKPARADSICCRTV